MTRFTAKDSVHDAARLATRVLSPELWRRQVAGLAPHPALRDLDSATLRAALVAQGELPAPTAQRVAWFPPADDRKDPWLATGVDERVLRHARRCCYLIGASAVAPLREDRVRLHHQHYGSSNSLCESEPFWSQPTVLSRAGEAYGAHGYSGYLLDARRILTVWHGWENFAHEPQVAILDFALRPGGASPVILPASAVRPVRPYPVAGPQAPGGPSSTTAELRDWVIVELERPLTGELAALRPPRLARTLDVGAPVYTLGFPSGLPLKLADGARILSIEGAGFRADLDTFTGNSGSPVFDARTHELLGIVVEGQKGEGDFEASPSLRCYVSNRVDSRVTGQLVLPVSEFAASVRG